MQKDPVYTEKLAERFNIRISENAYQEKLTQLLTEKYGEGSLASSLSIEELLVDWDDFVMELCETSYDMSFSDFSQDLVGLRGIIQLVEEKLELKEFKDHPNIIEVLTKIDTKFASISFPNPNFENAQPWWLHRILKKASYLYFTSIGIDLKGYDIEVV